MYQRGINREKLKNNPVVDSFYSKSVEFTLPFRIKNLLKILVLKHYTAV